MTVVFDPRMIAACSKAVVELCGSMLHADLGSLLPGATKIQSCLYKSAGTARAAFEGEDVTRSRSKTPSSFK